MSARQPRFEIVHSDAGWFARFRGANGRKVWQTEMHTRRGRALNAIGSFVAPFTGAWLDSWWYEDRNAHGDAVVFRRDAWNKTNGLRIEIRDVDERTAS